MKVVLGVVLVLCAQVSFASFERCESKPMGSDISARELATFAQHLNADLARLRIEILKDTAELERLPKAFGDANVNLGRELNIDFDPGAQVKYQERKQRLLLQFQNRKITLSRSLFEKRVFLIEIETMLGIPPTLFPRLLPTVSP